jgi:ribose 1,5-bisphosphokinase
MIMANLFYLIGASGSGKDSLLAYARKHIAEDQPVIFAHRYITRPADSGGENHIALDDREFRLRKKLECFSMHWYSHDTYYGIGQEVHHWLQKGSNVVVNGSRAYLDEAANQFPQLVPILVTVEQDKLAQRLIARGRESQSEIKRRLQQARELESTVYHPCLIRLDNNGQLTEAGEILIKILANTKQTQCA